MVKTGWKSYLVQDMIGSGGSDSFYLNILKDIGEKEILSYNNG